MNGDLTTMEVPVENAIEGDNDNNGYVYDGKKCGICMKTIIDRGLLDCCQDWFCFACIESWAAITNFCPLCENEFQLITCLPVYDTIRSEKVDETSFLRDDDWCIEGNSAFSFPSYYIDENAVTCLDGASCRIRGGSATVEDTSILDTSIACDSCDLWYHAFCVGFDPEGTSDDTWLCPRCVITGVEQTSEAHLPSHNIYRASIGTEYLEKDALCGSVSISVVDVGETAVVVSMLGGHQQFQEEHENLSPSLEDVKNQKIDPLTSHEIDICTSDPSERPNLLPHLEKHEPISDDEYKADTVGSPCSSLLSDEDPLLVDKAESNDGHVEENNAIKRKLSSGKFPAHRNMDPEAKKARYDGAQKIVTSDIMSIVQEEFGRPRKLHAAALRVKKIMKRPSEDADSSTLLQQLKEEIKATVCSKSMADVGKAIHDPKLLAAFRSVVCVPEVGMAKKAPAPHARLKKAIFQKGNTRENLTKKIYALSSGRRRREWTRDCEIEFWKHRCMGTSIPPKVETLKSVLQLLKSGSVTSNSDNPIFSRVYLADTSIFPRKDDIQPMSSSVPSSQHGKGNENVKLPCQLLESIKPSIPILGNLKDNMKKEPVKGNDMKSNKKKWAMEVLSRKTAQGSSSKHESEEDAVLLKGNFPLLAQLPADLRPVLAPCCRNKIPIAVRKAQLYHLAECFLREADLSNICRNAETELAIADAVNVEKNVADRSNSKLVYVNLCSQELSHRSNNKRSSAPNSDHSLNISEVDDKLLSDPDIEAALRTAGLCDSPLISPSRDDCLKGPDPAQISSGQVENVLEMECSAELDISGDFEYDLGDEDYMGSAGKVSKANQEDGELKLKVLLSALNSDKNDAPTFEEVLDCNAEGGDPSSENCEELYGPDEPPSHSDMLVRKQVLADAVDLDRESWDESDTVSTVGPNPFDSHAREEKRNCLTHMKKRSGRKSSVYKKVKGYVKEHIRPLCKSGVISTEQYRWAVSKTTDKVMRYHSSATDASFLIKEGEKVKKLGEQYVEASQHQRWQPK